MNGKAKKKTKKPLAKAAPVRCNSVRLELPATADGVALPNPDWIQVAADGDYRGHPTGPFKLDAEVFAVIVRNFRAHPSYLPDGSADVIPFDFSHASECDPTSGSVPVDGTPARAWARELDVREGPKGIELWALTRFLEPALTYRAEGSYQWTSICVWPDATDPKTGERIGWYLSSIAFTNDPFIQGMTSFAAERGGTSEEVLEQLRELFEIPAMSPPDEIIGALAKLEAYARNPTSAPVGVDVDCLVGALRQIFNLPTLAGVDEIFAQADALLVALAEALPVSTIAAARKDPAEMDHYQNAVIALAARLRVKLPEKPEQITALLLESVDAVESAAKVPGASALESLGSLFKALKVQDVESALAQITATIQDAAELKRVLPELAELEVVKKKKEEDAIGEDVDVAMSFRGINEAARDGLLELRRISPEGFEKRYPKPTKEQLELAQKKTPASAQRGAPLSASKGAAGTPLPKLPDGTVPTREMFNDAAGANPSAKGVALVKAHMGDKKLTHEAACDLGFKLARALHVEPTPASGHANAL